MANTYPLQVITPEKIMLSEDVQLTIAPGSEGYLGVLAGHAALMTSLLAGEVRATMADGRTTSHIVVSGGLMEVSRSGVVILADQAERSDEIDVSRAEVDLADARRMLAEVAPGTPEAKKANASVQHAEARIRAGRGIR
jgi:F-type H+-transporting ATPase subunit epsilon